MSIFFSVFYKPDCSFLGSKMSILPCRDFLTKTTLVNNVADFTKCRAYLDIILDLEYIRCHKWWSQKKNSLVCSDLTRRVTRKTIWLTAFSRFFSMFDTNVFTSFSIYDTYAAFSRGFMRLLFTLSRLLEAAGI